MIVAVMAYALTVTLLLGFAALAVEKLFALRALPRRGIWAVALIASLMLPCAMMLSEYRVPPLPIHHNDFVPRRPDLSRETELNTTGQPRVALHSNSLRWPKLPDLDPLLIRLWVLGSVSMLLLLAGAALQLRRSARSWRSWRTGNSSVLIAERVGPAVFGVIRPRIVIPAWLLDAPLATRLMVLRHEREHIAALDPLLLTFALVLVALAPWNVLLWWQLRRLRFAMEVDCDARVLRRGADPVAYGHTLLAVGRHRSPMPLGSMALTEPVSDLERRIRLMVREASRPSARVVGMFLGCAITLVASAGELNPPGTLAATELRKAPPSDDLARRLTDRFESIVEERYPELLSGSLQRAPIVYLLFKQDGTVERSEYEMVEGRPEDTVKPTADYYSERFHIAPDEIAYFGLQNIPAPKTQQKIVIVYTEQKKAGQHYVSQLLQAPDTRSIDRSLVQRYFSEALSHGVDTQQRLWVLFDSAGQVLETGEESSSTELTKVLQQRFPGIDTQFITLTPVTDDRSQAVHDLSGKPLQLYCVWLRKGSPLPSFR